MPNGFYFSRGKEEKPPLHLSQCILLWKSRICYEGNAFKFVSGNHLVLSVWDDALPDPDITDLVCSPLTGTGRLVSVPS